MSTITFIEALMQDTTDLKPARQGTLDGLCGLYSVINGYYWLNGKSFKRRPLFKILIDFLSHYESFPSIITEGMTSERIESMFIFLQTHYSNRYPIKVKQPYINQRKLTLSKLYQDFQHLLHSEERRAIIFADSFHWSVMIDIDARWIYLFDSCGTNKVSKSKYSLRHNETKLMFYKEAIFLISLEGIE